VSYLLPLPFTENMCPVDFFPWK